MRAVTATASGGQISLNQLHEGCGSRIKYQKVCPQHGEVTSDEIVSGYEYSKGQYAVIKPDEIQAIRKQSDKAIEIRGFVARDELEPLYYSGRTYYLMPDGPVGEKAYHLLWKAMQDGNLVAVVSAILHNKEQLAVIRPLDGMLGMSVLHYASQLRQSSEFADELTQPEFTPDELKLTQMLVDASTLTDFDIAAYKDSYTDTLTALIDAKIAGQEIVAQADVEEPKIINLMDALKASVEQARAAASGADGREATKAAPSAKTRTAERRKKTG